MADALFVPDGDAYVPTEATLGPWGGGLLHGGAVSALAVTVLEAAGDPAYNSLRFSADFVRALPQVPLHWSVRELRKGRRLEVLECDIEADGRLVARCSLMRVRPEPVTIPEGGPVAFDDPPEDSPESFHPAPRFPGRTFFAGLGIELRVSKPGVFGGGLGWFRLMLPVVTGHEASPMVRAVAAADFGNGISGFQGGPVEMQLAFPNADLVVHLARPPEGEWIRLQSVSSWQPDGYGLTRSQLADTRGLVGAAEQSLVISET
jgi:acyl-CoA thioesterase